MTRTGADAKAIVDQIPRGTLAQNIAKSAIEIALEKGEPLAGAVDLGRATGRAIDASFELDLGTLTL